MATRDRLRRATAKLGDEESPPVSLVLLAGAVAAAVAFPVVWLVIRSLEIGSQQALDLLFQPSTLEVVTNSVALVAGVTLGSILIGVPLAVLTVQTDLPFRRFWTVVVSLPLVVPSYIGAFAFVSAFGPHGVLSDLLAPLGVESIPTIYGFEGATLVLTLFTYPYVFLTTRAALLSFDGTLMEAARTLNHGRWAAFRKVTLPQIAPGIAAGSLLVALYALSDFGTPAIMHFEVFTQQIYVAMWEPNYAALLSLQLLTFAAVILALENRISESEEGAHVSRGSGTVRISLGLWKGPALLFCALVATLCLVVPVGILFMWLTRSGPGFAGGGFGFSWVYGANSVWVAALAALAATLAALPVAYLSGRSDSPLATLFERASYVGYATPGVVLGLALVYFSSSNTPELLGVEVSLYQTIPLLVFAYVVRFLPQAVGSVRSSVLQVDPKLTEAARTLGESPGAAFRRVTLPLVRPGVVAGAALVFLTTMKELPATLLVRPTGFETLVTYIWRVQDAGYYGQAAVPALALVGVSALSMLVLLKQDGSLVRQEGGKDA
ncbi:iron ABC transporter permease [Halorussus sp. MSC15.2]|uniref:ABC transporter permease n=1 Tax=Halorussus sp. MSC15.2 TaxID=2283638 RepID=UPI0013D4C4CC|nr:iron ABC transporter permease [Halorussus sp. MSC15.2]NEU56999.1 iron ABC transporter permease [Halorussus sp. MSC15.2]